MLHGGGGTSVGMEFAVPLAEEFGVVLLVPNARARTWDAVVARSGPMRRSSMAPWRRRSRAAQSIPPA